jgi:predicted Fe-Mo cluster-binding NifX family protein
MKTIALSIFGNRISSRLDMAEKLMIVKVDNMIIKNKEIFLLDSADILKKLNTLVNLKPDVLICGGLTNLCEKKLKNYKIRVIPWVRGETENILKLYLNGVLIGNDEKILTRN